MPGLLFSNCIAGAIILFTCFHSSGQSTKSNVEDYPTLPALNWKFSTGSRIFSSPVISNGVIYVGGCDSILHALDIKNGKQLWQLRTGGEIRSAVCIDSSALYLNGGDGKLYSVDKKTGKVNWSYKTKGERRYDFADYFNSTPVLKNNIIYFGSGDSCMYAVNSITGNLVWYFKTGNIVHTTPAAEGDKLYFGSFDGYVYALNIADGKEVWKFKTIGHDYFPKGEMQGSPVTFEGLVFIGARDYNLYALDAEKGYCRWNKAFTRGWALCTGIYDSTLYIGSADERVLISADPLTGHENWNKKMEFLVFGNNAYTNSMLYLGTTIGKLHGINLKTGEKVWSYETDAYKKNRFNYFKADDSYRDDIYSIIKSNEEFVDAECMLGGIFTTPIVTEHNIIFASTEGIVYCLDRQ